MMIFQKRASQLTCTTSWQSFPIAFTAQRPMLSVCSFRTAFLTHHSKFALIFWITLLLNKIPASEEDQYNLTIKMDLYSDTNLKYNNYFQKL